MLCIFCPFTRKSLLIPTFLNPSKQAFNDQICSRPLLCPSQLSLQFPEVLSQRVGWWANLSICKISDSQKRPCLEAKVTIIRCNGQFQQDQAGNKQLRIVIQTQYWHGICYWCCIPWSKCTTVTIVFIPSVFLPPKSRKFLLRPICLSDFPREPNVPIKCSIYIIKWGFNLWQASWRCFPTKLPNCW